MKRLLTIVSVIALGVAFIAAQDRRPPGTNYSGRAFTFNKIADGVYHAVGTGSIVVMSNATIIEGDNDVLVVDSHVSPGGAWALREELKTITLEADPLCRELALPFRSLARQPDLRPGRGNHRSRVRAAADGGGQVDGLTGA